MVEGVATPYPGYGKRRFWGMLTRKERWSLSWPGYLVLTLLAGAGLTALLLGIYPFLALTLPVESEDLVVEGWITDPAVRAGAEYFKKGSYKRVFTTGGPISRSADYPAELQTYAHRGAVILRKLGIPEGALQKVPSSVSDRDRTYNSALALRDWLRQHQIEVRSLNIVTEGAHARRTRLLFEKALGSGVKVGVIAVASPDFDPQHWWRSSEGVREVVGEGIAYLYVRFLFYPAKAY